MKIINKKTRKLAVWLCGVVAAALFLGWLLPHLLNKKALNKYLRSWLEASFAYTTPVGLETVDVALRQNGRLDLYLQELELDAPNPAFAFPWLKISTVRTSVMIYELWNNIAAQIQLRHAILRLQWDEKNQCNLDNLSIAKNTAFPFAQFSRGDFDFKLMNAKIILEHPLLKLNGEMNGEILLRTIGFDRVGWRELNIHAQFSEHGTRAVKKCSLRSKNGWWHYEVAPTLPTYEIAINNLPLRVANIIMPTLPTFPAGSVLNGVLFEHAGEMEFRGEVNGFITTNTPLVFRRLSEANIETYKLELYNGVNLASVFSWEKRHQETQTLHGEITHLNLSATNFSPSWLYGLGKIFPSARLTLAQVIWRNINFSQVQIDVIPTADEQVDLFAESVVAGGKISLLLKGWKLNDELPESFSAALEVPALGETLLHFANLLPPIFQINPVRGSGKATLRYQQKTDTSSLVLHLDLANIAIPTLTLSETLTALLSLPNGMTAAENLIRQARAGKAPATLLTPQLPEPPEILAFNILRATYEINDGNDRLTALEIDSPQIGKITGFGQENADGSFRLTLIIKNAPVEIFQHLSPETKKIAIEIMNNDGLRIECLAEKTGGKITDLYVQDIFRKFVEQ